jgi:hypothetical protein
MIYTLACWLQVGLDNPAELKAAKLARSVTLA